jgi:hypothetical protein
MPRGTFFVKREEIKLTNPKKKLEVTIQIKKENSIRRNADTGAHTHAPN